MKINYLIYFIFFIYVKAQDRQPCEDLMKKFYQILDQNQDTFQFNKSPEQINSDDNEFRIEYDIQGFEDQKEQCQMEAILEDSENCSLQLELKNPYEHTHIYFQKIDYIEDEEALKKRYEQFEEPIRKFMKNLNSIIQKSQIEDILVSILDDAQNFQNVHSITHQKIDDKILFIVVFKDEHYEEEEHPFFIQFEDNIMVAKNDFVQKALYLDIQTKPFLEKEMKEILREVVSDYYHYQKFLRPTETTLQQKRTDFCSKFFEQFVFPITEVYKKVQFEKKDDFQHDLFVDNKDNIIGGFRCEQNKEKEILTVLQLKVFFQKINMEESYAFNIDDDYDQSQIMKMLVESKVRIMYQSAGIERKKLKIFGD